MENKTTFDLTWAIHPISCHYWWPMEFVFSTLNTGNATRFHKISKAILTHWCRDKMAVVSQTTLSNAFSWMKMFEFRWRFHWSLFLRVQLTIFQHWFRYWLGAGQATSHYLNQWWLFYWRIYASLGLNELNVFKILYCHRNLYKNMSVLSSEWWPNLWSIYMCVYIFMRYMYMYLYLYICVYLWLALELLLVWTCFIIKSPRYTGGDFMFLYRFVRRRRPRGPQILVHAISFQQLFVFLSFLAWLLVLTCTLPD